MEMSYTEYIKYVDGMLQEEEIRNAVNSLKPLGKFVMSDNGQFEPIDYAGYTLITPTFQNDCENENSYRTLLDIKNELSEIIDFSKVVEAPNNALHMTVARLISGETFKKTMMGSGESKFLSYLRELFSKLAISGHLSFEIKGISVFPQGVIAAMISPTNEEDYRCLQNLRDYIYSDKVLKCLGVERKRIFHGHITLFYIEKELDYTENQKLCDAIITINKRLFSNKLPFSISQAEVRKFNNFLSFDREEDWAIFEFIKDQGDFEFGPRSI